MSLRSPEDNSPSKSLITKHLIQDGVEIVMEVREEYSGAGSRLLGQLVLWRTLDDAYLTARVYERSTSA